MKSADIISFAFPVWGLYKLVHIHFLDVYRYSTYILDILQFSHETISIYTAIDNAIEATLRVWII